jgi:hypothetical protein
MIAILRTCQTDTWNSLVAGKTWIPLDCTIFVCSFFTGAEKKLRIVGVPVLRIARTRSQVSGKACGGALFAVMTDLSPQCPISIISGQMSAIESNRYGEEKISSRCDQPKRPAQRPASFSTRYIRTYRGWSQWLVRRMYGVSYLPSQYSSTLGRSHFRSVCLTAYSSQPTSY